MSVTLYRSSNVSNRFEFRLCSSSLGSFAPESVRDLVRTQFLGRGGSFFAYLQKIAFCTCAEYSPGPIGTPKG